MVDYDEMYGRGLLEMVGYRSSDGEIKPYVVPAQKLSGLKALGVAEPVQIAFYSRDRKTVTFLPRCTSEVAITGEGNCLDEAVDAMLPQFKAHAWLVRSHLGHLSRSTFPKLK